ncbi:MAG: hypothetical protein MJZ85_02275 [Bacteroidales bacterium]|nr:hypothetical protein [Bacteroidales bacterium]
MATITLTYDGRSSVARKAIDNLMSLGVFSMETDGGFKKKKKNEEESPYDPEFVKMIKESEAQIERGEFVVIDDVSHLWDVIK